MRVLAVNLISPVADRGLAIVTDAKVLNNLTDDLGGGSFPGTINGGWVLAPRTIMCSVVTTGAGHPKGRSGDPGRDGLWDLDAKGR